MIDLSCKRRRLSYNREEKIVLLDASGVKKDIAILTAIAWVAASLSIAAIFLNPQNTPSSQPQQTLLPTPINITRQNEVIRGNFTLDRCGELIHDPSDVEGAPENPAILSRSEGDQVTIPLCIRAALGERFLKLDQVKVESAGPARGDIEVIRFIPMQDGSIQATSERGLDIYVSKSSFLTDGMERLDFEGRDDVVDETFNVTIAANPEAKFGTHMVGIGIIEPDNTGVRGFGSTLFLYVEVVV
jgi:hypothetical protein